jgi:hypothetical protein
MRGKIHISFSIVILSLFNMGCKEDEPVIPKENKDAFAIYFLKDTSLTIADVLYTNLADLKLADKPWISQDDIDFYDWSSHCIYLKTDKSHFFHEIDFSNPEFLYELSWVNRPIVITANKEKIYIGYFWGILEYKYWPFPDLFDFDIRYYPVDVLHMEWPYPFANDIRNNQAVKNSLINQGILHEGLSITIDSLWIDNTDTATVRYAITLKNNDTDNLYVLDPDKMGSELFHYFNNGLIFFNSTNSNVYKSDYKEINSPPLGTYESTWFIKIMSGESINRMIILKGYPYLPEGEYFCNMDFNNPYCISKDERMLSDGRYWIGPTRTELFEFNLVDSGKVNFQNIKLIRNKRINDFTASMKNYY